MFFDHTAAFRITDVLEIWRGRKAHRTKGRDIHVLGYRLSGSGEIFCDGKTYPVSNGVVLSIPPNIDYSQSTPGEHVIAVHLETFGAAQEGISLFAFPNPTEADGVFLNLLRIWSEKKSGYQYRATAVLCEFLAEIQRLNAPAAAEQDKVADGMRYIYRYYTNAQLKVADVARYINFSEVHFRRLFVKTYGMTPHESIISQRMALACRLLRGGGLTIREVAAKSGFSDPKYFSACFKKHTGLSPGVYIEQRAWQSADTEKTACGICK